MSVEGGAHYNDSMRQFNEIDLFNETDLPD